METTPEDKLFADIRPVTRQNFGDDSLAGKHERDVLLAAIEAYSGNIAARLAGVSEQLTHAEAHWQLLQAKAAACDAFRAWEPEGNRNSTSWNRVHDALAALVALEKKS